MARIYTLSKSGRRIMILFALALILAVPSASAPQAAKPPSTLKGVLLEQLQTTHNKKDWFAPASVAVEGLTAEQASWSDGKGNHSIGQLAAHLVFWNRQQLAKFKGEQPPRSAATTTRRSTASTPRSGPQTRARPRRGDEGVGAGRQDADDQKLASVGVDDRAHRRAQRVSHRPDDLHPAACRGRGIRRRA